MMGALLPMVLAAGISPASTWHANLEVYRLARQGDSLAVITDGSAFIAKGDGPLVPVTKEDLPQWAAQPHPTPAGHSLPPESTGTHTTARFTVGGVDYSAVWGDTHLWQGAPGRFSRAMTAPAGGEVYDLSEWKGRLLAATSRGLWQWSGEVWSEVPVPRQLPAARIHTAVRMEGGEWLIGSISGLWQGRPNNWTKVDDSPIRQALRLGDDCWVVKGSGALDKFDFKQDRHYTDVLYGSAKRAFASCLYSEGSTLWIGGYGGWIKRGAKQEEVYPDLLKDQVVTAIYPQGKVIWVGTQKGLYRCTADGKAVSIKGLERVWITALAEWKGQLYVGGHTGPLYQMVNGAPKPVPGDAVNIRSLAATSQGLVVGCAQGALLYNGRAWQPFETGQQETLCLSVSGRELAIGVPKGLLHFRVP